MTILRRRALALVLSLATTVPAFASDHAGGSPPLPVVASFSILGDLVQQVGGDRIRLHVLVGAGSDPHTVQPTPAMAREVAQAAVLFANGLGFEGWIERLLRRASFAGRYVEVSDGVDAREADDHGHHHHHHHHDSDRDPHAWQDVRHAVHYVGRIAEALCAADAAGCNGYRERAAQATMRLQALDAEIRAAWAAVPEDRRRVVTSHDAFGYYADAYRVRFFAPQGIGTETEPSARDVARLVWQIRSEGIRALFVENLTDPRLIAQIGRETGLQPAGTLYADALSPADGPASTYEAMMRHNTTQLVRAVSAP